MSERPAASERPGVSRAQRVLLGFGVVVVGLSVYNGVSGGLREIPKAATTGQVVQTWAQLAYGLLAAALLVIRFGLHRRVAAVSWLWMLALGLAAGVAPVAWGGTPLSVGIFSGLAGAAAAFGLDRLLAFGLPSRSVARLVQPGAQ